jgi:heat shock protein HtpX
MYNTLKTGVLLVLLAAILMLIGGALGGRAGLMMALIFAVVINFVSYWYSDKIVLSLYGAQEVSEAEAPELYRTIRHLVQRANLPCPRVCDCLRHQCLCHRTQSPTRCVRSWGTLRLLDHRELEGCGA